MLESTQDLIAVFVGVAVLWLIFGVPSKGVDDGRGHRLGPEGSADDRHRVHPGPH